MEKILKEFLIDDEELRDIEDLANYLDATGFEALIGYLYLSEKIDRLEELINLTLVSR